MLIFWIVWLFFSKKQNIHRVKFAWLVFFLSGFFMFFSPVVFAGIVAGDPRGRVTLVEFFDYTCPHCQNMAPVIAQLIAANPHLRVIYRPLPLLGENALFATRSVFAAQRQKNFFVLHDALLNAQSELTPAKIMQIASVQGFDTQRLLNDINDPHVKQAVAENIDVAKLLGIQVLPTLLVGVSNGSAPNVVFYGETPAAKLQQAIVATNKIAG